MRIFSAKRSPGLRPQKLSPMPLLSKFRALLGVTRNVPNAEAETAPDRFSQYRDSPDKLLRNFEILSCDMGQLNTMMLNLPVDASKRPLPWYTYPAIEYLRQFDFTDKYIFEFGCGNSSLFWLEMGATVWS